MLDDHNDINSNMDSVEIKKKMSRLRHEVEREAKAERCLLCGKKVTSFANSHSIPQMILNNISVDGKLYWMNSFIKYEEFELDRGLRKAGTFHCICAKCDSTYFKDYENENNLVVYPTTKVLAEIAVKNYCQMIEKRRIEIVLNNKTSEKDNSNVIITDKAKEVKHLDLRDYQSDLNISKKEVYKNRPKAFKILYWKKLNYVFPIAAQTVFTMHWDLENKILNDIHDAPDDIKMQGIHLFIFPLKESSVVCAFFHNRDKVYNRLIHQFQPLPEEEKLSWINYWLIANCENYFLSKNVKKEVLNNEKLRFLGEENDRVSNFGWESAFEYYTGNAYVPVKHTEIPNLLSEEYKIR